MESIEKEAVKVGRWQKRLLPVMNGMLTGLTIFFLLASFVQLFYLHKRIENFPILDINPAMKIMETGQLNTTDRLDYARWKALVILEGHALDRRYHQANMLLMSRIWKSYLGFVTGMIMAMVGAAFILGKLRETETTLNAEGGEFKFSITTASPGLILSTLGTILMLTTIIRHSDIEVKDSALYTWTWALQVKINSPMPFTPAEKTVSDKDEFNPEEHLNGLKQKTKEDNK